MASNPKEATEQKKDREAPKLIPPDPKRCQTEIIERLGPFQLGGPPIRKYRCENKPIVIATEKKIDPVYGERGSMSLCARCLKKFKNQAPRSATFRRLP